MLLLDSPRGTYSREKFTRAQCQSHPWDFHRPWNWEAEKAPRELSNSLQQRGQPGPAAMGLAQGHSAGWQQSWDMNSRLLRTLDNSDDAQMSMKGLNLWARLKSKDLRPLPGSWLHVPSQSGTHRKGTLALSASTPNFLLAMFAHHQLQCAAILQDLSTFLSCVSGSERCKIHTTVSPKLKGRTSEPRVHKHQLHWPQGLDGVLTEEQGKRIRPGRGHFNPLLSTFHYSPELQGC